MNQLVDQHKMVNQSFMSFCKYRRQKCFGSTITTGNKIQNYITVV